MPIARNKKSIYDQLRDREKERENGDSIPMLINKFLTANCEEKKENLKSIFLVFIESVGTVDVFLLTVHIIFHYNYLP